MGKTNDCSAMLVALALVLGASAAPATDQVIRDDFVADPDFTDGEPLQWAGDDPCCVVLVDAVPGEGLRLMAEGNSGNAGVLMTSDVLSEDVTIRVQSSVDTAVSVLLHLNLSTGTAYSAFVCDHCFNGSRHIAGLIRWDGFGEIPLELSQPAGFDPSQDDVALELSSRGVVVECRIWPASTPRPDEPLYRIHDERYRSGVVAFAVDPSRDGLPAPVFLRWAEITVACSEPAPFRRGDANDDGSVDISDPVYLLLWLFLGGLEPTCLAATNVNGDEAVDLSDTIALLNYLFLGGPAPAGPYPDCGMGGLEADDRLACGTPPRHCP